MAEPAAASRPAAALPWKARLALIASIVGPGIITANVDNDAGGLTTYSQAGAQFGLALLWILPPVALLLVMVQEMVNRMGVVTGQGLSDLVRERFGVKVTFYLMVAVLITNVGNVMAEFAGVAAAGQVFGLPAWLTVPASAAFVWVLVLRGTSGLVERVFLGACVFYVAYPVTAAILRPDMGAIAEAVIHPHVEFQAAYLVMGIGVVGTTIAPWMQFYQQAAIAKKNIRVADYRWSLLDTVVGCVVVNVVAACIVVVCALTLHPAGVRIETAGQAAAALEPLAGHWSALLFALGLGNASLFAASILPLSTAYTICEALGWESSLDAPFRTAPQFYTLYAALIVIGATTALLPGISLVQVMFWSQVINGLLLPVVLAFILLLVNDKRIMGAHVNGRVYNLVCWACTIVLGLVSAAYVASLLAGLGA